MSSDAPSHYVRPLSDSGLIADLDKGANRVYMLVGELRALTEWDERLLLRHLGCDPDAPRPSTADADQLMKHSIAYLSWVRDLCKLVDRPVDRHDILHGAYELCASAAGPLDDRVTRCGRACDVPGRDGLSARGLMALGEVAKGWLQATVAFDGGASQERAVRVMDLTAPNDGATLHLHPRRLQWLFAGQHELEREIGANVARRMHEHLTQCTRCTRVARELHLVEPQLPTS